MNSVIAREATATKQSMKKSANNCYPYYVWSETTGGSGHYLGELNSGTFSTPTGSDLNARSVRCVHGFETAKNIKIEP